MRADKMHVVLEGAGDAGKDAERLPLRACLVCALGSCKREVCRDFEEGLDIAFALVHCVERRLRDLGCAEGAILHALGNLGCRELVDVCH